MIPALGETVRGCEMERRYVDPQKDVHHLLFVLLLWCD